MNQRIKENAAFLREFVLKFQHTGTLCPTSKWAAQALTNPLRSRQSSAQILELGSGTGSVTVEILRDMQNQDELTLCEINPLFMNLLREKLSQSALFHSHRDRVNFFEGPVQELPENKKYDLIVCALPFLNFELNTVKQIFEKLRRMSHEETVMTYYEYIGIRSVSRVISPPARKRRMKELDYFFRSMVKQNGLQRERVWLNFLPINIYTLRLIPLHA